MVAAWLLALHPWFLRYASEARGYSLVLLLVVLVPVVLKRAVEGGCWRWWAAFGAIQFAMVATWPAMIYTLVVLNGAALALLAGRPGAFAPGGNVSRWFVCTALAGMASLQLILPLVPQMRTYLEALPPEHMDVFWLDNTLSHFLAGAPWRGISLEHDSLYPCLWPIATARPVLFAVVAASSVLFVAAGLFRFARRSVMAMAAAAIFFLPGLLAVAHAVAGRMYLYEWYLIVMLPGFAAFCAVGLAWLAEGVVKWSGRAWGGALPVVLFLTAFAALGHPFRLGLITNPLQPLRDSVLLTRPSLNPGDPAQDSILTASFLQPPYVYDPLCLKVGSVAGLSALMARADADGKTLWVNIGHSMQAHDLCPELWAFLNDARYFEPLRVLRGFHHTYDRVVARYRPGTLGKASAP